MKRVLGRYFPGVVLLALISILSPTNAYASIIASASNSTAQSITSATWKVAPETSTSGTTTGALTLNTTAKNQYFDDFFNNFGTVDITAFSYSTSINTNSSYTLSYCPTGETFNHATTPLSCSGGTLPTSLASTGTITATLTVGNWLPIEISIVKPSSQVTVSATVSGSQIRAATNTTA